MQPINQEYSQTKLFNDIVGQSTGHRQAIDHSQTRRLKSRDFWNDNTT